ncbi:S8 family serine peptidase [Sphingomicrobium arenosum]|uniref:S8 family serine peptidase n=1 Tax=Sphingomicrobium arenosum TaxID=2233861 RepID=UPI002240DFE9|nr:S8 family serine peptidase [Sphingomicrobium arenosum]
MIRFALAIALSTSALTPTLAAAQDRPVITQASELPQEVVTLGDKPSVLLEHGGPAYEALFAPIDDYARTTLDGYRIDDAATRRQLVGLRIAVAMAEGRWDDAVAFAEESRASEDKPAARETAYLLTLAYADAARAVDPAAPGFADTFETAFAARVADLDWTLAQDWAQSLNSNYQILSPDLIIGQVGGSLDPLAEAQGGTVPLGVASTIVSARGTLERNMPIKDRVVAVLSARLAAEAVEKVDNWTPRLVELSRDDALSPVRVGIWDSGVDPAVLGPNMWTNPAETRNGVDDDGNGFIDDIHGIAFDPEWLPTTAILRPMPEEDLADMETNLALVKGSLDSGAGVDSEEARLYRETLAGLGRDDAIPFALKSARLGLYLHGTATGYTSLVGNPTAQAIGSRFDFKIDIMPDPMDAEFAEAMAQHIERTIDYYRAHDVRVVNMSWRITEPQVTGSLTLAVPDADERTAQAKANFDLLSARMEAAMAAAPEILFVAGAGNEDEDVDFVRSFPAGINLPNLITVGAVDVALQPASFTSYGSSIDLYANGFEVPSKAPGGLDINISGTSLAAPQVTNLAAKLLAIDPSLSTAELRALIEDHATMEGELAVIHPAASIAALRAR